MNNIKYINNIIKYNIVRKMNYIDWFDLQIIKIMSYFNICHELCVTKCICWLMC